MENIVRRQPKTDDSNINEPNENAAAVEQTTMFHVWLLQKGQIKFCHIESEWFSGTQSSSSQGALQVRPTTFGIRVSLNLIQITDRMESDFKTNHPSKWSVILAEV